MHLPTGASPGEKSKAWLHDAGVDPRANGILRALFQTQTWSRSELLTLRANWAGSLTLPPPLLLAGKPGSKNEGSVVRLPTGAQWPVWGPDCTLWCFLGTSLSGFQRLRSRDLNLLSEFPRQDRNPSNPLSQMKKRSEIQGGCLPALTPYWVLASLQRSQRRFLRTASLLALYPVLGLNSLTTGAESAVMPILQMGDQASGEKQLPGLVREEMGSAPEELLLG